MLCVKAIVNSLLAVKDVVSEHDQIDSILNMLHKEFNLFFMQMYGAHEPQYIYDVEVFLYVQEAQLDKFHHDLAISFVSTNDVNINLQIVGVRENSAHS